MRLANEINCLPINRSYDLSPAGNLGAGPCVWALAAQSNPRVDHPPSRFAISAGGPVDGYHWGNPSRYGHF